MRELQSIILPIRELDFVQKKEGRRRDTVYRDSLIPMQNSPRAIPTTKVEIPHLNFNSSRQNSLGEIEGIGNLRAEF